MSSGNQIPLLDIKIGDSVLAYDNGVGVPAKVLAVPYKAKEDVYRIELQGGRWVEATANHQFLCYSSQRKKPANKSKKLTVKQISRLGNCSILIPEMIDWNKSDHKISGLLMGLFLGDGCSQAGNNSHRDSFINNSKELRSLFVEGVEKLGDKVSFYSSNPTQGYITKKTRSKHPTNFAKELKRLGLYEKKSWEKFIPSSYITANYQTRKELIEGLVLTDGCVSGHKVEIYSNSRKMLEGISTVLMSFGIVGKIYERKPRGENHRTQYIINFPYSKCSIFNFRFKDKNRPNSRAYKFSSLRVKSVTKVGKKSVRCITVDHPSHLFILGNGLVTANSGKTHTAAFETACYALGEHPHKKIRTPNVSFIVTAKPLKEGIEKDILPKLLEVVGSKDIREIKKNSQGTPAKIIWRNDSVSYLMSQEQDDVVFEGTTLDFAWIDEPVRRSIFIAISRGLMKSGGHIWFSCTPLDQPWMYEEIYIPGMNGSNKEIEVFEGSSDENIHIAQENRDKFYQRISEDEIEARRYGKFAHLAGRVFKSYNMEINRITPFDIPPHWPVWVGIDPHRNKPHAVAYLAVAPNGYKYLCNEIYHKCEIFELAEFIKDVGSQYNVVEHLIDTSAQEDGWTHMSARQMLEEKGVRTKLAQKKNLKMSGITLINQLMKDEELFIFDTCVRAHREFTLQTFKQHKRDQAQILEEPEKKFDDITDCVRYILVESPDYGGVASIKEGPSLGRSYEM